MAEAAGEVPQVHRALLADHVTNIWQRAILSDGRACCLIPPRTTNVCQCYNAVTRVVDWRVEDGFTGCDPAALSSKIGFVTGVVPDDFWFPLFEPVHVTLGFVSRRVDGIRLVDRPHWDSIVEVRRDVLR